MPTCGPSSEPTSARRVHALTRREVLRAGGLGLGLHGLGLPGLLRAREYAATRPATAPTFGRAKACILLFMWGGPAQQETWDLKPDAPEEVRGEFRPIATNVPGLMISEHFPALATRAHRLAVIRSVHHADVNHLTATHELLTGRPSPRGEAAPLAEDWPHFGAVLARLNGGRERTPCPRSCRCGRRSPTARLGSSSRATARGPAGWGLR